MNTQNLEFLKNGLKYLGFEEKLGDEMEKQMKSGAADFQLTTQNGFGREGADKMDSTLHFRKSDSMDMYFFNKYDATVKHGDEQRQQTFYIQKNHGMTTKEAYNLLQGHSVNKDLVNKEGEKYNAWVKLDLANKDKNGNYMVKQFHSKYGFDLEKSLAKHPVKELSDPEQKDKLIKSLEKGNIQSVTFVKEGKDEKMFLGANPQAKTVDVYDGKMKLVKQEVAKDQSQGKEASASVGESPKKAVDNTGKKQSSKKATPANPLMPKKHVSHKKGIGI